MKNKNKNKDRKEINYENIKNLANALRNCGYKVNIYWEANWYCIDQKSHQGIELIVTDVSDGEGEPYNFIFNREGQRINYGYEGEEI